MATESKLAGLESRVFRSYIDDGLWDVSVGVAMIAMAAFLMTDQFLPFAIVALAWPMLVRRIKAHIARTRTGFVEFSGKRQKAMVRRGWCLLAFLTVLIAAGLFVSSTISDGAAGGGFGKIPFGMMIAILIGGIGWYFDFKRGYAYGALILGAFVAAHVFGTSWAILFVWTGSTIAAIGIVLLGRFLKKHPKQMEATVDHA